MLKRLLSVDKWSSLSLLQLRDELARRGLRRAGSKKELIDRLKDNEQVQVPPPEFTSLPEAEEDLEFHHLENLNKSHLLQEINKRRPNSDLSLRSSKKKLIDVLSAILIDEKGINFSISDTRSLIMSLHRKHRSIPVQNIVSVLDSLSDEMKISQIDMNVLRNTDNNSFIDVWEQFMNKVDELSPENIVVSLKASKLLQELFYKNFKPGIKYIDSSSLTALLHHLIKKATTIHINTLAELIQVVTQLNSSSAVQSLLGNLRAELSQREINLENYSEKELLAIMDALPAGSYATHKDLIDGIIKKVYGRPRTTNYERALQSVFSIHSLGAELPFNLVLEFEFIPREFLRRISPMSLFQAAKVLSDHKFLSDNMAKEILELLAAHNFMDAVGLSFYANYVYMLYQDSLFSQMVSRTSLLNRCIVNEENLDLPSTLKLAICYLPHMTNDSIDDKLLQELSSVDKADPKLEELKPLLEEALSVLVEITEKKPIYHYQYQSMSNPPSSLRIELSHSIAGILESIDPTCNSMLSYYASHLYKGEFQYRFLKTQLTKDNVKVFSQLLWKFKNEIDTPSLINACELVQKTMRSQGLNDIQTTYYLTCAYKEHTENSNLFIPMQGLKYYSQEYLSQNSVFTLPLYYNLHMEPSQDRVQELLNKVNLKSCYGEILAKNVLVVSKCLSWDKMGDLTSNFSFIPETEPPLDISMLNELTEALLTQQIDHIAYSSFIKPHVQNMNKKTLAALLRPVWEELDLDIKSAIQNIEGSLTTDKNKVIQQLLSSKEILEVSKENLNVLNILALNRLHIPEIYGRFMSLLPKIREENDLWEIVRALLKTASVIGQGESLIEQISDVLERYRLWHLMPLDIMVDYLFILSDRSIENINSTLKENFLKKIHRKRHNEAVNENKDSKMECYSSFKHDGKLEPRRIIPNFGNLDKNTIQYSTTPEMPQSEMLFYCKVKAILNAMNIPSHDFVNDAVKLFNKKRSSLPRIKQFRDEFLQLYGMNSKIKKFELGGYQQVGDASTGWVPDYVFYEKKIGILFLDEEEVVTNHKGEEIGPVFLHKIIKEQLEKFSGLRNVTIKHSFWNSMEDDRKVQLIKNIKLKFNLN